MDNKNVAAENTVNSMQTAQYFGERTWKIRK